jgi:hypothetical protein
MKNINETNIKHVNKAEVSFDLSGGRHYKDIVISIINTMINSHRLQYLTDWEADHSTEKEQYDEKAEELKKIREQLRSFLKDADGASLKIIIEK